MRKVFNFNAGPAMVPEEVLQQAQTEMLDWEGSGMSIMEIGHRTPEFKHLAERAEADLRALMSIPKNYRVLFLAGGATTQFAMVPLNLMGENGRADYVDTGIWSKKAIAEASRYGKVNVAAKLEHRDHLAYIPSENTWSLQADAAYLHYTPNETIDGVEFHWVPETGNVPLVADMTSIILSQPIAVEKFGIIYAGAQKNMGQAGLNVVIIRDDLIKEPTLLTPTLYKYITHSENASFYNTPPTYAWYIAGLVFKWMKEKGGVDYFYKLNQWKAKTLYSIIDEHQDFYHCRVAPECRSMMNVMFYLHDEHLTPIFLDEAQSAGMTNLRGHRISGGIRASIYNAMPAEAITLLGNFMQDFVKRHG